MGNGESNMYINESDSILFDMLSESSSRTFFFFSDLKTNTSRWSKGAVEYFGLSGEILCPALELWIEKIYPDDVDKYLADFAVMVESHGTYHDCEYRIKNYEGEYVWVNCKGIVRYDEEDNPSLFAGFVTNMGTRNKIDPVTNLFTVFEFRNDIDAELQRKNRGAAMNLSIHNFKRVNDLYSYSFGDKILKKCGEIITEVLGGNGKVYRLEGSDFGIIYPNATREEVLRLYEMISDRCADIVLDEKNVNITFRASGIFYPEHGKFVDPLQARLSYALSKAKEDKTDKLVFYIGRIHEELSMKDRLRDALTRSVKNDCEGFRIVYQPILDAKTRDIYAVEALLRWSNEEFGHIGPMEFVPILEDTGLINIVGKWILTQCIGNVAEWNSKGYKKIQMHVNMSLIQFMEKGIVGYIKNELERFKVEPNQLVLELTESCRVEYTKELGMKLLRFKAIGVDIALDDFGTGYASLSVLKDIPTDIVKLDHTLVRSVLDGEKEKTLIEFIIMYCQKVNIKVCAEGVENEDILEIVAEAGAHELQGYHFDRPLELSDLCDKYFGIRRI